MGKHKVNFCGVGTKKKSPSKNDGLLCSKVKDFNAKWNNLFPVSHIQPSFPLEQDLLQALIRLQWLELAVHPP